MTNSQIDPLYIPVPLYASPAVPYNQCSSAITCIDHPATIDLSRLASVLGAPAASLKNVPLPGHDHLLTTRNGDQPEWWNVIVIPVTSPAGLASVESAKSYAAVKALENVPGSGIGVAGVGEVPTNAYLWFQTLPGGSAPTPGPVAVQLHDPPARPAPSSGGAALDDGTGYYEVDAQGDVAAFGARHLLRRHDRHAPQQADRRHGRRPEHRRLLAGRLRRWGVLLQRPVPGSTGGNALNKPIVGMTATLNGTGYWLVASDGGVFSFQRPVPGLHRQPSCSTSRWSGMGLDRTTGGYWLVASDGGVFSYNAPFYGSTGTITLNKPVVGIAPVSDGSGYRLVASRRGSVLLQRAVLRIRGSIKLNKPVIAGLNNNSYDGYWLVASDGGVFTYSPPARACRSTARPHRAGGTSTLLVRSSLNNRGDGPIGLIPSMRSRDTPWTRSGRR